MADPPSHLDEAVRASIRAELGGLFDELRRFVDRRISELSMEIHATVQLVDYSETNLSAQLARIHEQIASVVAVPATATHNSGLELEAVVQATESAANQIMEAAEAIGAWLQAGGDPAALQVATQQVNAIFEACTFQDLTGQRVRRAIEHLQNVEAMLSGLMHEAPGSGVAAGPPVEPGAHDLGQSEVDQLFG
ncbi:MAG TPA: hypothetical protein VHT74_07965 [Acetobacteraceae bacterium]|jgi:chemotaxis protein CheZ|nr:hypothetical protein [Acetobacteraceae bacterium]